MINFSAGVLTSIVVVVFAVVKFTEGAWLIVIIGPAMVFALIRLNREYAMEAEVLDTLSGRQPPPPPAYARRTVFVLVDSFDLATLAALRYARSLRPTTLRTRPSTVARPALVRVPIGLTPRGGTGLR